MKKATEKDFEKSPDTSVDEKTFKLLFDSLMEFPSGFKPLKKIEKLIQDKITLLEKEGKVDWATAELLAYASLVHEGKDVRMSGQDVKRGTFSHRHAVLFDENTDKQYNRVENIKSSEGKFRIFNSLLSEYGVLGFEYGYGMANPNALVLWEAQFGDFSNGAQTMIDQFISSAEQKWNRMNGIVMLLPHGYEGQGPEHSSARMERYLQMCAELNMVVTNVTTASNFFHLLRRQLAWSFRKPLINFSPKANLRHVGSYSDKKAFLKGGFQELIDDSSADPKKVKRVILCTGKIYFDLNEFKEKNNIDYIALVRLEQIYPLPEKQLQSLAKRYANAKWVWVQEEPLNMGAASFLRMNLVTIDFTITCRTASAATATGFSKVHVKEQEEIIKNAFQI
jgi:2-oxoglutarate dehydrogenase E1 component